GSGQQLARSLPSNLRARRNTPIKEMRRRVDAWKFGMRESERIELKTNITNRVSKNLISLFILVILIASTVVPAMAQTKRRPRLRRQTRAAVPKTTPAPQIVYYNVN